MKKLDDSLGYLINRAAVSMRWALEEKLSEHDLTAPQWAVLSRLMENNGQSLTAIGKSLHADKPTVTGVVDRLEQKGFVKKSRDLEDRRIIRVYLTTKGKNVSSRLPELAERVNQDAIQGMNEEEVKKLKKQLLKIQNNLG